MRKNLANDTHDKEKKRKKIKWNFSSSSWVFCDCCARLRPSRVCCAPRLDDGPAAAPEKDAPADAPCVIPK
jgi:hypothetical protein